MRRRMRMYIWKQWKKPRTKVQNLRKLGTPEWQAYHWGNTRRGYWRMAGSAVLHRSVTNEKLAQAWYMTSLPSTSVYVNCTQTVEPPCTERYARRCESSAIQLMGSLLLDSCSVI
ncbi:hypothetical protein [Paenibacillus sp. S150]|uniref:hypothetical protein n=1 Tax=Paenibacillus sp. S150 TaxID=2749826 RepID=UPI0035C96419